MLTLQRRWFIMLFEMNMNIKTILLVAVLLASIFAVGCDNFLAKNGGGNITKTLPAGRKLVNVSWKDNDLWFLTRPMVEGEKPETYVYSESSAMGIAEGSVTIIEQAAGSTKTVKPSPTATPFVNVEVRAE